MRKTIAVAAILTALVAGATPSNAATPSGGTLSKPGQKLSWTGAFQIFTVEARCDVVDVCDHFKIKVNMGEGARVRVVLPAPNPATDLDFFIYDPKGVEIASSGNLPGETESATFTHKAKFRNKVYDVAVVPYLILPGVSYNATASVSKYVK